jgi:hypothetical protein
MFVGVFSRHISCYMHHAVVAVSKRSRNCIMADLVL